MTAFIVSLRKKLSILLSTTKNDSACNSLEISSVKRCSIRCKYCPQDQLMKASKENDANSENINFVIFSKSISNIKSSGDFHVHWTGYSEACLNIKFPEMVNLAEKKGFLQEISTTLVGHQRCIDYLSNSMAFYYIGLHLPDNNGLMENGSLKVNEKYLNNLELFLDNRLQLMNQGSETVLDSQTFGSDYHPEVRKILEKEKYKNLLKNRFIRSSLHSRSGGVSKITNLKIGIKRVLSKGNRISTKIINFFLKKLNLRFYYCSYKRLKQPVLLGNGDLNICCMDYGLRSIIGNLTQKNINEIYRHWEKNYGESFSNGTYIPCNKCEYYELVNLKILLKIFIKKYLEKNPICFKALRKLRNYYKLLAQNQF